jgi:hypothetical protein
MTLTNDEEKLQEVTTLAARGTDSGLPEWNNVKTVKDPDTQASFTDYLATVHMISPLGFDWGAYTSASFPVFFRP